MAMLVRGGGARAQGPEVADGFGVCGPARGAATTRPERAKVQRHRPKTLSCQPEGGLGAPEGVGARKLDHDGGTDGMRRKGDRGELTYAPFCLVEGSLLPTRQMGKAVWMVARTQEGVLGPSGKREEDKRDPGRAKLFADGPYTCRCGGKGGGEVLWKATPPGSQEAPS